VFSRRFLNTICPAVIPTQIQIMSNQPSRSVTLMPCFMRMVPACHPVAIAIMRNNILTFPPFGDYASFISSVPLHTPFYATGCLSESCWFCLRWPSRIGDTSRQRCDDEALLPSFHGSSICGRRRSFRHSLSICGADRDGIPFGSHPRQLPFKSRAIGRHLS